MLRRLSTATFVDPETGARRRGARGRGGDDLPPLQAADVYRTPFTPEAYQAPDPASLGTLTRQAIAQLLGRAPSADEIGAVQGSLASWFRESHDLEQAEARRQHEIGEDLRITAAQQTVGADAYGRAIPVNIHGGPAASGLDHAAAPTIQTVDPQSRLEELLRSRYSSEVGRIAQSKATQQSGQILSGLGSSIASAIFGSAGRGEVS